MCSRPPGRTVVSALCRANDAKMLQVVPLTFVADKQPGRISGKVRLETDIPGVPVLEVDVNGQILAAEGPAPPATPASEPPAAQPATAPPSQQSPAPAAGSSELRQTET